MNDLMASAGSWLAAPDAWLSRWLLERALAVIYLLAFTVVLRQWPALLGERGLTPIRPFMDAVPFRHAPSLFYWRASDRFALGLAWVGAGLAVLLLLGVPQAGPAWVSLLVWLALWALYLSFVNVGQVWYGFGWESLLLEAGFLACFLGSADEAPPRLMLWLFRWLLFRVEFGAGLIKLRGDPCWRDFTCLAYHHETQPLPNPLSWYFHHLPGRMHRLEVLGNHAVQLVVPFGLFLPQPIAGAAALLMMLTQAWLLLSGNFAWLNLLTLCLAISALDDAQLGRVLPMVGHGALHAPAGWLLVVELGVTILVLALSVRPVRNLLSRRQLMNATFDPLHLVNTYGAFGSITRERYEVILEGTRSAEPDEGAEWREYAFKAKPGDPRRRPPQVAPYHLRLDWLMWFAALSTPRAQPWLYALVAHLLQNDPATLRLLGPNPFPDEPPRSIRASLYHYRFSTARERREQGVWWVRNRVGTYLPPMSLAEDD